MSKTERAAEIWAHAKMCAKTTYSVVRSQGLVGLWLRVKEQTIDVAAIVLIGQGVSTACDGFVGQFDPAPLLVGILLVVVGLTLFALKEHAAKTEKEFRTILKEAVGKDDKKIEALKDDFIYYAQARGVVLKDKDRVSKLRWGLALSVIALVGVLLINGWWPEKRTASDKQLDTLATTVSNLEQRVSALAHADKTLDDDVRDANRQIADSMTRLLDAVAGLQTAQSNLAVRLDELSRAPAGTQKPPVQK